MRIDAWAKRGAPVVAVVMIGVAAYLQARGLSSLVGATLAEGAPSWSPHVFATRTASRATRHDDARDRSAYAILERNAFDSVTGPIRPHDDRATRVLPATSVTPGPDWYADPPCEGARAVLIASSADPAWSFAALATPEGQPVLRRRGDAVGTRKVAFIGDPEPRTSRRENHASTDRVWLTAPTGARCQLRLGEKLVAAPPPKATGDAAKDFASHVHRRSDHEVDVDRATVEGLLANPAELMKTRVVPEKDGDRVVGMRLFGIKADSPLAAIGLQNGDQVNSINGFEMSDPQRMLEAYAKLAKADALSIRVVRGGKPVTLDLSIR
jgi:general secretion pathway protein C